MSREAMKLALDALVAAFQGKDKTGQVTDAITAIREALAEQPAQQVQVAWTLLLTGENQGLVGKAGEKFVGAPEYYERVDVYTSPQRTWVGLTHDEIKAAYLAVSEIEWAICGMDDAVPFTRIIEAKLKEKNA